MVGDRPRYATLEDLARIEQIVAASYEKYLPRMDRPPAPLLRDYSEAIERRQVWTVGNPVEGLVVLLDQDRSTTQIEIIAVHPSAQGSGLGRRLVEFAEDQAILRGHSRLALSTNEAMVENPPLYQHLGFIEVDRRIEDGYHRIYMEKVL